MKKLLGLCLLCATGFVPGASAQIEFYAGGSGDGYASATLVTSFPMPVFVQFYAGGSEDGFDSATLVTSFPMPVFVQFYAGGSGDGYAGAFSLGTPLPVELTRFEAVADGLAVVLAWATASETNNAGFEMHSKRSLANSEEADWQVVGFVEGHGTTLEPQSYTFRLEDLPPGRHVFRLKQIDFDGAFEYSPEVEVVIEVPGRYQFSPAYPNPFNLQTRFSLAVARQQQVEVLIYDVLGRQVQQVFRGVMAAGRMHVFVFEAGDLPSGLYLVHARGKAFVATRRVMLVK